jgi:hypothetical protein
VNRIQRANRGRKRLQGTRQDRRYHFDDGNSIQQPAFGASSSSNCWRNCPNFEWIKDSNFRAAAKNVPVKRGRPRKEASSVTR